MTRFCVQKRMNLFLFLLFIFAIDYNVITAGNLGEEAAIFPGHLEKLAARNKKHKVEEFEGFLPPYEFFKNYVGQHKPVVFKNAVKQSRAFQLWTDEYLMNLPGSSESEVEVEQGKKENRSNPGMRMTFKEFLQVYREQNIYLVNRVLTFLEKDVLMPRSLMCEGILDNFVDTVMWFSSGGTKSVLHNDDQENINCLYRGTKELLFIDYKKYKSKVDIDFPVGGYSGVDVDKVNFTKYPGLKEVEYHYVNMQPGDCLYIPYKWFHQVTSHDSNLAINIWWRHQNWLPSEEQCNLNYPADATIDQFKFETSEDNPHGLEQMAADPIDHFFAYLQETKALNYEEFEKKIKQDADIFGNVPMEKYKWTREFSEVVNEIFTTLDKNKDIVLTMEDIDFTDEQARQQLENYLARLEDLVEEQTEKIVVDTQSEDEQKPKDEL